MRIKSIFSLTNIHVLIFKLRKSFLNNYGVFLKSNFEHKENIILFYTQKYLHNIYINCNFAAD